MTRMERGDPAIAFAADRFFSEPSGECDTAIREVRFPKPDEVADFHAEELLKMFGSRAGYEIGLLVKQSGFRPQQKYAAILAEGKRAADALRASCSEKIPAAAQSAVQKVFGA